MALYQSAQTMGHSTASTDHRSLHLDNRYVQDWRDPHDICRCGQTRCHHGFQLERCQAFELREYHVPDTDEITEQARRVLLEANSTSNFIYEHTQEYRAMPRRRTSRAS